MPVGGDDAGDHDGAPDIGDVAVDVEVGSSRNALVHGNDGPARDQRSGAHESSSMVS
jgi:hypothetical protein